MMSININISSLKILDALLELIQIEVQCSKYYLKTFLSHEVGVFRNNIEKKPQKPRLNLKKYVVIYLQIIFALSAI